MKERVQLFTQAFEMSDNEFSEEINTWLASQEGELVDVQLIIQAAMQSASAGAVTRMAKVHKVVLVVWRPKEA